MQKRKLPPKRIELLTAGLQDQRSATELRRPVRDQELTSH